MAHLFDIFLDPILSPKGKTSLFQPVTIIERERGHGSYLIISCIDGQFILLKLGGEVRVSDTVLAFSLGLDVEPF